MIYPTLHLNGTSKGELCSQLENASNAVRNAIEALSKAYPNGRDYYPQGQDVIYQAVKEHSERIGKLESVQKDIAELWEHVTDAEGGRP